MQTAAFQPCCLCSLFHTLCMPFLCWHAMHGQCDHLLEMHNESVFVQRTQKGQLAGFEGCSFQPTILPVSAAKPGRGVAELSLGDAMRRALTRVGTHSMRRPHLAQMDSLLD